MTLIRRFAFCTALLVLAAPLCADPPATAGAASAQSALDRLVGKRHVIGLTVRGGSRCLGRVLTSDHGLYVVQTFHYTSAMATTPVATPETATVTGRRGRRSQVTRWVTTNVRTQNVIADDVAVSALLSGVTGSSYRPHEQAGPRLMVTPADVICIQELSPPAKPAVITVPAVTATAAPPASSRWTLKTLWQSPALPVTQTAAGAAAPK